MAKNRENTWDSYVEAGTAGHFPLFFNEWIAESLDEQKFKKMTFSSAATKVEDTFKKIAKHRTPDKKKIALQALPENERKEFVLSFIKLIELRVLNKVKELH